MYSTYNSHKIVIGLLTHSSHGTETETKQSLVVQVFQYFISNISIITKHPRVFFFCTFPLLGITDLAPAVRHHGHHKLKSKMFR